MDELIKNITEKAGINLEQAKQAVSSVVEFVKGKLPMLGEQLQAMLAGGEGGSPLANAADALKKKLGL